METATRPTSPAYAGIPRVRRRASSGTALVDDAWAVLAEHVADHHGMCACCRATWNRLVPYPCTQAAWAHAVVDRIPTAETLVTLGLLSA